MIKYYEIQLSLLERPATMLIGVVAVTTQDKPHVQTLPKICLNYCQLLLY